MPPPNEKEKQQRAITIAADTDSALQARPNADKATGTPSADAEDFYTAFWDNVIKAASVVPQGEDPAFWPVHVMYELDELVTHRAYSIYTPQKRAFVNRLAPFQDSLRNIKVAYAIIASPLTTDKRARNAFAAQFEHDQGILEIEGKARNSMTLNDTELEIVRRLCETPRYTLLERDHNGRSLPHPTKLVHPPIPFDLQKRTYSFSEVPPANF